MKMHGVALGVAEIISSGALIVSATPPAAKPGGAPAATVERDAGAADFAPRALAAVLGPEGDLAGAEARLREALPAHLAGTLAAGVDLAIPTEGERAEEHEFWRRAEAEASAAGYTAYLER